MNRTEIAILEQVVIDLINEKFKDKIDDGGVEYIQHLWNVAHSVETEGMHRSNWYDYGTSDSSMFYHKAYIVALLHDIFEDTDTTEEELRSIGCDNEIIEAIKTLTHKKNEKYLDYILRVSENDMAKIIKIYDLENNMDITRLKNFGDYEMKRLKKYWYSYKFLYGDISYTDAYNSLYKS